MKTRWFPALFCAVFLFSCGETETTKSGTTTPPVDTTPQAPEVNMEAGAPVDIAGYWAPAVDPATSKMGFINTKGEWMIQPAWIKAFPFSEGFAGVSEKGFPDNDFFFINTKGEKVMDPSPQKQIIATGVMVDGRVPVNARPETDQDRQGIVFFVDKSGKKLDMPNFESMHRWDKAPFPCKNEQGKWGFIGTNGKWAIPAIYDFASVAFWSKLTPIGLKGNFGYIDNKGATVVNADLRKAEQMSKEGYGVCKTASEKWAIVDSTGKVTEVAADVQEVYNLISGGMVPARKGTLWGFINTAGQWVIEPKFPNPARPRDFGRWSEDLYAIDLSMDKRKPHVIYINAKGETIVPGPFLAASDFRQGIAAVAVGANTNEMKFGLINKQGQWVVKPTFLDIGKFTFVDQTSR